MKGTVVIELVIAIIIELAGWIWLIVIGWKLAAAIMLIFWGNNINKKVQDRR